MKVYSLRSNVGKAYRYLEYSGLGEEQETKLINGEKIDSIALPYLELKRISKKAPDFYSVANTEFYVNERTKAIIESLETESHLNFVPITILEHPYYLINTLHNIPCFDWENSQYTEYNKGVIKKVDTLVVKEHLVEDRNIFRISEIPVQVCISKKLKKELNRQNVTGITYRKL